MHQNRLAECEILKFCKKGDKAVRKIFFLNVKGREMCAFNLMCMSVCIEVTLYGI